MVYDLKSFPTDNYFFNKHARSHNKSGADSFQNTLLIHNVIFGETHRRLHRGEVSPGGGHQL